MHRKYTILIYYIFILSLTLSFWLPHQALSKENAAAEESPFGFLKINFKEKTFSNLSIIDAKTNEVIRKNVFTWQKQQIPVGDYSIELDIAGFKIKKDNIRVMNNQTTQVDVKNFGFIQVISPNEEYYRYDIYDIQTNRLIKKNVISINKQIVPVGTYTLLFNIGGTRLEEKNVVVSEDTITVINMDKIGQLIIKSFDNLFHKYMLRSPDKGEISRDNLWTNYKHQVVAGTYTVEVDVNGITTTLKDIVVTPNNTTIVNLTDFGSLEIKFAGNSFNRYDIYQAGTDKVIKKNILMREKESLPKGEYTLVFNIGGLKVTKENISISPNENTLVEINNFGELKLTAAESENFRYDIIQEPSGKTIKARIPLKESSWIPVGQYTVRVNLAGTSKTISNVTIQENQTTELEL